MHRWLFVAGLKLDRFFPDKNELAKLLEAATAGCGREVTHREIEDAIQNSLTVLDGSSKNPKDSNLAITA